MWGGKRDPEQTERPRTKRKKEEDEMRPVDVARIEELSAAGNGGPALPREHGKVGEGGDPADEGVAEVVLPALSVGGRSLGDHHHLPHILTKSIPEYLLYKAPTGGLMRRSCRGHGEREETKGEGADAGGAHLLDRCACGRRERLHTEHSTRTVSPA